MLSPSYSNDSNDIFHSFLFKNTFHLNLGTPKESHETSVKRKAPATLENSNGKEGGCDWVLADDN